MLRTKTLIQSHSLNRSASWVSEQSQTGVESSVQGWMREPASEIFAAKENCVNKEIPKRASSQKVNSFVCVEEASGKQVARMFSELWLTVQNPSTDENLRTCIVLTQGKSLHGISPNFSSAPIVPFRPSRDMANVPATAHNNLNLHANSIAGTLVARTVRGLWPTDPQTTSLPLQSENQCASWLRSGPHRPWLLLLVLVLHCHEQVTQM